MNVLVTNTRVVQSYDVIRGLRPYAKKIVATMYGVNPLVARLSHAANSRYVDKRYYVPSPVEDWREGRIQEGNTEREEAYIQAVLRICEQEEIDVVYPSWEPMVYVFSKNKKRFTERNIFLPVPDYPVLIRAMDKYSLMKAAEQAGFPCPKTFIMDDESQLDSIEKALGYPAVVKPRLSAGSRGVYLVKDRAELLERVRFLKEQNGLPLIQEYLPGSNDGREADVWIFIGRHFERKGASLYRQLRTVFTEPSALETAAESFTHDGIIEAATELCRELKLNGVISIQTKLDPRDGLHKLLEINFYNFLIPMALGINAPLLALKVAQEEEVHAVEEDKKRTVFLVPVYDLAAFGVYLVELLAAKLWRRRRADSDNRPPRLSERFRSLKDTYTAPKKVFDPYFSNFFRDPLVSLTWWAAFGVLTFQKLLGTR